MPQQTSETGPWRANSPWTESTKTKRCNRPQTGDKRVWLTRLFFTYRRRRGIGVVFPKGESSQMSAGNGKKPARTSTVSQAEWKGTPLPAETKEGLGRFAFVCLAYCRIGFTGLLYLLRASHTIARKPLQELPKGRPAQVFHQRRQGRLRILRRQRTNTASPWRQECQVLTRRRNPQPQDDEDSEPVLKGMCEK